MKRSRPIAASLLVYTLFERLNGTVAVLKESVMVDGSASRKTNPPRPSWVLHAHCWSVQLVMVSECSSEEMERKTAPPSREEGLVH